MNPAKDEPPSAAPASSSDLPTSYGKTKVVVLPVDPFHVHAYWEVTEKDRLSAMKRLDPMGARQLSWVLRFHDVTSGDPAGGDPHFDVFVDRAARNWYIELWSPGRRYWVELGTAFGARFSAVSRSSVVDLPPNGRPAARSAAAVAERPAASEDAASRSGGIAALAAPSGSEPWFSQGEVPPAEAPASHRAASDLPEPGATRPREPRKAGPDAARVLASSGPGKSAVEGAGPDGTSGSGGAGA